MSDLNTVPPPPSPPPPPPTPGPTPGPDGLDDRTLALIVYVLYLVGFATGWITAIVGVVLAYVNRDRAPEWLKSHYTLLIRTFWISLVGTVISIPLVLAFGLGLLLMAALLIWFVVRCAVGLSRLLQNEPYPNPETWLV